MSEPLELNEVLQSRYILSVEAGTTAGWMVINLALTPEEQELHPDTRLFLTVFIGGRKPSSNEDDHHWTCALHSVASNGCGTSNIVRDERDPTMRMSSAQNGVGKVTLTGVTRLHAPTSESVLRSCE